MKQRLQYIASRLRTSFWLIPTLMMTAAIVLAQLFTSLDSTYEIGHLPGLTWLRLHDPSSARALLTIIATSTISVAGTVFSITMVALTLASNQFGPRLVRNFMRDRGTQVSLGIFLSTFVYALMVTRVLGADAGRTEPSLSVSFAVLLALGCIAYLIYFIHNVAQSIQIDNITFHINREFRSALNTIYPAEACRAPDSSREDLRDLPQNKDRTCVRTRKEGYVQLIDRQALIDWAREHDCCIQLQCHPGTFLYHWGVMAEVFDPPRHLDSQQVAQAVHGAFTLGPQPTAGQDIIFSIRQLSQVAVRALSPGINDPFTAYTCIDRLMDGIGVILQRPPLPNCYYDHDHKLRLVVSELDLSHVLAAALDEILEYGRTSGVVMRHICAGLIEVSDICCRREDRQALYELMLRIKEDCAISLEDRFDIAAIEKQLSKMRKLLE
uniref:DUF2254 domain-containing protein n=1 Tax=Microbulbifer agarilyticus TaxID=260552 RepID=UPI000255831B|nr:DUF2254 domain-containing protein [Microbulbifer agarilyticus]